ncbi:hypothetical protein [Algicella marina]|uniref:Uncharacterized protein n=1 Tax=Algicella marina TaxID=2683284 RepID=A0A6P1SYW1_9RHOB|nr:hypothetical protein [Algicella marina]QHQ34553.1 hypothetical protein GO499_04780 [Algicella marina]
MSGYVLKTAELPVELPVDWRAHGLEPDEHVCDDLGWTVMPVTCELDLAVAEQFVAEDRSFALLEGGVPGTTYMVSARVRTTSRRTLTRSYVIRIAEPVSRAA